MVGLDVILVCTIVMRRDLIIEIRLSLIHTEVFQQSIGCGFEHIEVNSFGLRTLLHQKLFQEAHVVQGVLGE